MVRERTTNSARTNNAMKINREERRAQRSDSRRRKAIIAVSLVGMGAMTAVSLLQLGFVKHLPDPPLESFDSDKVNLSETAFPLGIPDGVLSLGGFAANIPFALTGGERRAQEQPLIPLLHAGKSAIEALVAAWYFYQMPTKEKAWCGYCIVGAFASWSVAALTLPEARRAFVALGKDATDGRGVRSSTLVRSSSRRELAANESS